MNCGASVGSVLDPIGFRHEPHDGGAVAHGCLCPGNYDAHAHVRPWFVAPLVTVMSLLPDEIITMKVLGLLTGGNLHGCRRGEDRVGLNRAVPLIVVRYRTRLKEVVEDLGDL